jgi:hypothetical protein
MQTPQNTTAVNDNEKIENPHINAHSFRRQALDNIAYAIDRTRCSACGP